MSKKIELTPSQIMPLLEDTIRNNEILASKGKKTITYCIEGQPGIAKTAIVEETSLGFPDYHYVKLNVSDIEVSDLIGYPYVSFEMEHNNTTKWVPEKIITHFAALGYTPTGETRMDYALPEWFKSANGKKIYLNLDDYSRATPMMLNATMGIVYNQAFATWKLPQGSTVILTTNPGDGEFLVTATDKAQKTRVLFLYAKASVTDWAVWGVKNGIDQRFLDLLTRYPEMVEGTDTTLKGEQMERGNLRNWTMFFDDISYYKDLNENWTKVLNKGSGSFPEEHMLLFYNFVQQRLDKLRTPEEILGSKDTDEVMTYLRKTVKDRQDVTALMTKRLFNYVTVNAKDLTDQQMTAYRRIIEDDEVVTKDIVLQNVKSMQTLAPNVFKFLMKSPKIQKSLLDE